jgi:hypothetical protein
MALQVSLTSLQDNSCSEWILTDDTGAYATGNTGGWGTPNLLEINNGDVTVAELIFSKYVGDNVWGTALTLDVIALWEDLTGLTTDPFGSGTTVANVIYTLTPTILTQTGLSISDGIYQVTYQVGDGTTIANSTNTSTITYNIAIYCNIECCIEQRLANVPTQYECETCDNSYLEITMTLWTLLQALKLAACSASVDKFMTILSTLQTACEDAGCECS